uniref:Phospholipase B1, membrane-associated n=1 Tax=Knipowitschia caucasica TaxID=637954 RepID=A0AAV2KGS2_KNICA
MAAVEVSCPVLLIRCRDYTVIAFPCDQMFTSHSPPTSVDGVRPSDLATLAAIGPDAHSPQLSGVLSKLQELVNLFSPSLTSPHSLPPLRSLPEQATKAALRLQHTQEEWKLVLLFVRLDQLCACEHQQALSAVDEMTKTVDEALRLLQSQLKKTIVSVALWDGDKRQCTCSEQVEARLLRAMQTHALQTSLADLLERNKWFDREDFSVVLQDSPLLRETPTDSAESLSDSHHTDKLLVQTWINLLQPKLDSPTAEETALPCPSEIRPFLRTHTNSYLKESHDFSLEVEAITGTDMPCADFSPSPSVPRSVHELRPGDVKVVAAMGDSLTGRRSSISCQAGNGVGSNPNNLLDVLNQYRGLSWSIGGDHSLPNVTTLPNILKYFNPGLKGFSVGTGRETSPQASLNQAVAGATSQSLQKQVRALVERMKNDSRINITEDWKLITVFIGGNDMCDFCKNSLKYSVKTYITNVMETLDYLHKEVPRTLVNLVEPLHIAPLREMHLDPSLKCPTWLVNILCPCVILPKENSAALEQLNALNRNYQIALHQLVESGRYDTRQDFSVVVQPFFREIVVPKLADGRPDRSFFSPDCFHLSQKAQTMMARSLWNNMLEPLGNKTTKQDFMADVALKCPTKASPYLRTYNNSDYMYAGPPPTTGPITVNHIPTSVHRLRPADITVVAALGDAATAGVAAKAKNLFDLSKRYRGVAWSIGGDASLETVTTIPNILKKFNQKLLGFSLGQLALRKGFNMAEPGAKSADIRAQAEALITALKKNKEVNFEQDWKLVTVFVGEMDLCNYCLDQYNLTARRFSRNLEEALELLYQSRQN